MKAPRRQFLRVVAGAGALLACPCLLRAQAYPAAINAGLTDPTMKVRLAELGCLVYPGSPADFWAFVTGEIDKWAKVIRTAGIKPE